MTIVISMCTWIVPPSCELQPRIQRSSGRQIHSLAAITWGRNLNRKKTYVKHCSCWGTYSMSSANSIHITALCKSATSCADGAKIKQHTPCVASRIVRLLATCPASGQENARFERNVDLPSNTRQQPSHMEARSTAEEVLKSKDRDLPRQTVKAPLCNPALPTWQTELMLCFGGMPERMLEMWPTCARNTDGI